MLERRVVTPDTALRPSRYVGAKSPTQGWIKMQATYDLTVARKAVGKVVAPRGQCALGRQRDRGPLPQATASPIFQPLDHVSRPAMPASGRVYQSVIQALQRERS